MSAREEAAGRVIAAARYVAATRTARGDGCAIAGLIDELQALDALDIDEPVATTADEPVTLRDAFMGGAMYVAYVVSAGQAPTKANVSEAADIFAARAEEAGR